MSDEAEKQKAVADSKGTKNDNSKFNWVTERSSCSLPRVFQTLREQVEEDVQARNGLRPKNSAYEFLVEGVGSDFKVALLAGEARRTVSFTLGEHGILVLDNEGKQMFEITLNFREDGQCKMTVKDQQREPWQVRRMALEELLFHGH